MEYYNNDDNNNDKNGNNNNGGESKLHKMTNFMLVLFKLA